MLLDPKLAFLLYCNLSFTDGCEETGDIGHGNKEGEKRRVYDMWGGEGPHKMSPITWNRPKKAGYERDSGKKKQLVNSVRTDN